MKLGIFRRSLLCIFLIFPLTTFAQSSFTISGYGKGFNDGDKIFLLYKEPGLSVSSADSTVVKNGAFEFKGFVRSKAYAGIYRNTNPVYNNTINDAMRIYLEPGLIKLTSIDTLNSSIISGTPLNNNYNELRQSLMPLIIERRKIKDLDALSELEQKDTVLVSALTRQLEAINAKMIPINFAFIKRHPNSYVSLVSLNELSANKKLLTEIEAVFPILADELKADLLGKKIAERIAFAKKMNVGMVAKEFSQMDHKGTMVKLSDYKGKYVLIDFWASWCLPCRDENPNVIAAYQKYKDKNFSVLGVSLDDKKGKEAWLKAIKDDGLTWTQVSDLKGWKNEAVILYGITSIPANVLIDPNGKIIAKDLKGKILNEKLSEIFGLN